MNGAGFSKRSRYLLAALCIFIIAHGSVLTAQSIDAEVAANLDRIGKGESEEVKRMLPELVAKHPNNPGVMYLQGKISSNGVEAAKYYQSIVDNFPRSEWADDALYGLYQYYYALGLYKTANLKRQQLERDYPGSPFLPTISAAKTPNREDDVVTLPSKEVAPAETTAKRANSEAPPPPEPYTLQIGAFSSLKNAEKQKSFFENIGMNIEITNKVRGGRSLYLVWAGSFTSADEAKTYARQIRQKYKIESIVVEKY